MNPPEETRPNTDDYLNDRRLLHETLFRYLSQGGAVCLWRLPNTKIKNLIAAANALPTSADTPLEELSCGFVVAPFAKEKPFFFVRAETAYRFHLHTASLTQDAPLPFHRIPIAPYGPSNRDRYIDLVNSAVNRIKEKTMHKVVPSRTKTVHIDKKEAQDPLTLFHRLCARYPHAFVALASLPDTGTWIGASPELLIGVDRYERLHTTALAGTQAFNPGTRLKTVSWTQKEIEEQALVSRYIINCFKQIRLREFEEYGPKTYRAGNLLHLKTDFTVDLSSVNRPRLPSVMLQLLHPTAAVCGMPQREAIAFLKTHEALDRRLYSGYWGPVNYRRESRLYVNLRCMQWAGDQAALYAGAGVTADSVAEKEWRETEMKMNTLLGLIAS